MVKLYTVKVSFDYVVVAEDQHDAYQVGLGYVKDALSDMSIHDVDMEVTSGVSAYGWDDDCLPYGGDGRKRTRDYKQEIKDEQK
jgi:hypothetical protein